MRLRSRQRAVTDVAYVVRPGDSNPELAFSLRSLSNLPHERVWVAGYKPSWVTGVEHIPAPQVHGKKHLNALGNLRALLNVGPERFVLMNDDFFIVRPVDEIPVLHRGPLDEYIDEARALVGESRYVKAMLTTKALLEEWGFENPLSYALHVPMVFDTARLTRVLDRIEPHNGEGRIEWRTVYGNVYRIGGERIEDPKILKANRYRIPAHDAFLSTADDTFRRARPRLRSLFPSKCMYELP